MRCKLFWENCEVVRFLDIYSFQVRGSGAGDWGFDCGCGYLRGSSGGSGLGVVDVWCRISRIAQGQLWGVCLRHLGCYFVRVSEVDSVSSTVAETFPLFWGSNRGWFPKFLRWQGVFGFAAVVGFGCLSIAWLSLGQPSIFWVSIGRS